MLWGGLFRRGVPYWLYDQGEGGLWLDEGLRILVWGQLPHRDYFETAMPGIAFLNAGLLAVFGSNVALLNTVWVAMGALLAAQLHALAGRVVTGPLRLLPSLAFVTLAYAPTSPGLACWPALAAVLAGCSVLCGGEPTTRRAAAAGVAFGCAALFARGPAAGVLFGTWVALAGRRSPGAGRAATALVLGAAAPLALAMGGLAVAAGIGPLWNDLVVAPFLALADTPVRLARYFGPRAAAQWVLLAGSLAAVPGAWHRDAPPRARLLACAGVGLLVGFVPDGVTPQGLALGATLLVPLFAASLEAGLGGTQPAGRRAIAAGVLLALAPGLSWGSLGHVWTRQTRDDVVQETHRAGTFWSLNLLPEVSWIEASTRPGDRVFLYPVKGGCHLLTATRPATSIPVLSLTDRNTETQLARVLAEIEAVRPAVGVWDEREVRPLTTADTNLLPLRRALSRLYEQEPAPAGLEHLRLRTP